MTLSSKLTVTVSAHQKSALDLVEASVPLLKTYTSILADGFGAGQADRVFHDRRTLSASTNEDLDLAGGLTDVFGAALTFVKVKGLIVAAAAANTNNVVVGGAASNGFVTWVGGATHTLTVRPGAVLALFAGQADTAGYAVTAATGDLLRVANSGAGTSVSYDIVIVGTSA
jgi:hypothetical protein